LLRFLELNISGKIFTVVPDINNESPKPCLLPSGGVAVGNSDFSVLPIEMKDRITKQRRDKKMPCLD